MSKYLDPRADLTFKKVFGEHKNLVISLVNAMLPLGDDEQVESIEYWPSEMIPDRTEVEKYSIVDVCCRDSQQREFLVEMQMSWTESFKKRVLLNASKAYVAQSSKGKPFADLQPVYALNFVNTTFQKDVDDYYHYYHLVHDKYTDKVIDGLHLIFVELPKFKPQNYTEKKMQMLWLRFLTEINENTQEAPAELLENPEVNKALEIVERAAFSDIEMRSYDKFWDRISVEKSFEYDRALEAERAKKLIEKAEVKAEQERAKAEQERAKAEEERAKAEQEKAKAEQAETRLKEKDIETARKLKATGLMSLEQIADITGLSIPQINEL